MINLTITVSNIDDVLAVFDSVEIRKYAGTGTPPIPIDENDYTTVSGGYDGTSSISGTTYVTLLTGVTQYSFTDPAGDADDWYINRHVNLGTLPVTTGPWSDPVTGEVGDLYRDPQYPPEVRYSLADQAVIDRIRLYIGDPVGVRREYGTAAISSIHTDGKTYEMDEKGWPTYVNMAGTQFTTTADPTVNGYKFLKFDAYIDDICYTCTTYSGACGEDVTRDVETGVDIWYYTFRNSDREIMEAYDSCPPPAPLTTATATSEVYMVQTAIDLLRKELWEDAVEDGARLRDEGTEYDPKPGLNIREQLLDDLLKRRDDLIKSLRLLGIEGVLID